MGHIRFALSGSRKKLVKYRKKDVPDVVRLAEDHVGLGEARGAKFCQ